MLSELELKVISGFFPHPQGMTVKELEESSTYSYERVDTALKSLEKKGIVTCRTVGNVRTYDLKTGSEQALLGYVAYAMDRKSEFNRTNKKVMDAVCELSAKFRNDAVILFGSYAKGAATAGSDVDVLFISEEKEIDRVALALRHKYGIRINAITVPLEGFKSIQKDNPQFYGDLVEFGVIVRGFERLFELIYR